MKSTHPNFEVIMNVNRLYLQFPIEYITRILLTDTCTCTCT